MSDLAHRRGMPARGRALERGFSLIEALASVVVLSIGLLGVAALQLTSLKSNHDAATRSQATFLAYDIIDRMRVNSGAAVTGAYNIGLGGVPVAGTVAGNDLVTWKQNILNTLPTGAGPHAIRPDGSVNLDPATNVVTVVIQWDDSHGAAQIAAAAGTSTTQQPELVTFTTTTQLVD